MRQVFRKMEWLWPRPDVASLRLDRHCVPLDGVRGIAVLLVLCYDCLKLAPGHDLFTLCVRRLGASGWIGVDLFFVLSGFLITGVLLETRGQTGYWRSFFLRRAVRIFPLYYTTLLFLFVIVPAGLWWFGAGTDVRAPLERLREEQLWYWLHAQNWLFAWQQLWPTEVPVKHFWSLAVEEQFYLVWPLAVACLSRRQLGWLCLLLCGGSLSLRIGLMTATSLPLMVPYVMTLTRLDGLCCGALLAIAFRSSTWKSRLVPRLPTLAVAALLAAGCLDFVLPVFKSESFAAYSIGHTLTALMFAALVGAAACVPARHLLARVLSWRLLTVFGKYSYAIYVFHRMVYAGVLQLDWSLMPAAVRGWGIFLLTVGGSLLAAQVSWVLLERPCLSLKRFFPRPDQVTGPSAVVEDRSSYKPQENRSDLSEVNPARVATASVES